jgi:hypothetical protein
MLLQGSIVAGLIAILGIETLKRSGNSNKGAGAGNSVDCDTWKKLKYEYDQCVNAGGGANPCSYGVYGNGNGTPPPPKDCGCTGAK